MNLNNKYGCKIAAVGHAPESDYRFKRITEREWTNSVSQTAKQTLFGTGNPTEEAIEAWLIKALKQTGNTSRLMFKGDLVTLGTLAAIDCFQKANLEPKDVDFIFAVSNTRKTTQSKRRQGYPSLADDIMAELQKTYPLPSKALCLFGQEACSVSIVALMLAVSLVISGLRKCVLVIAAEKATELANPDKPLDSNLFGDGAGAILLQRTTPEENDFLFFDGVTNPYEGEKDLIYEGEDEYFNQDGQAVHKRVGGYITDGLVNALSEAGIDPAHIKALCPHQPSGKTTTFYGETMKKKLPTFRGKIYRDENVGNTSSASTFLLLSKLLEKGEVSLHDLIVLHVFGAGMTEISCGIQRQRKN